MFAKRPFRPSQVCIKEVIGQYEISAAFDDSCRDAGDLFRGDIRVYDNATNKDITEEVTGGTDVIVATIDNLFSVKRDVERYSINRPITG